MKTLWINIFPVTTDRYELWTILQSFKNKNETFEIKSDRQILIIRHFKKKKEYSDIVHYLNTVEPQFKKQTALEYWIWTRSENGKTAAQKQTSLSNTEFVHDLKMGKYWLRNRLTSRILILCPIWIRKNNGSKTVLISDHWICIRSEYGGTMDQKQTQHSRLLICFGDHTQHSGLERTVLEERMSFGVNGPVSL